MIEQRPRGCRSSARRRPFRALRLAVGLVAVSLLAACAGRSVVLVTPEEAAQPDAPVLRSAPPFPSDGPKIEFVSPVPETSVTPPIDIDVRFVGPVDLASLEVIYVKLIGIDITRRVRPHATPSGIHIEHADLPSGKHRVRISIADVEGRLTTREASFRIE